MNKEEYIHSKLNELQQQYHEEIIYLRKMLNEKPEKYDMFSDYNKFPERKRLKCSCGNDMFYYCHGYICSKCFLKWYLSEEWKGISIEEKITYYGIEIKAENI